MCFVFGPAKGGKKNVLRGESTLNLVLRKWRKTETGEKNEIWGALHLLI